MKALQIILGLSIINSFSLHSMNIILYKNTLKKSFNKIKKSKNQLAINIKQPEYCSNIKRKIYDTACAGNIIATAITGDFTHLLLMHPQILDKITTKLEIQKKSVSQLDNDLIYLQNQSNIIQHLNFIINTTEKIKALEYELKHSRNEHSSNYYTDELSTIKNIKFQKELFLAKEIDPLLKTYSSSDISKYLQSKNDNLKLNKKIKPLLGLGSISVFSNAGVAGAILLESLPCYLDNLPTFPASCVSASLLLSISIGLYHSMNSLVTVSEMDYDDKYTVQNTMQLLKIYQDHIRTVKNQQNQMFE
jgi:hypothetical protein